jgi:hypothetical protein
VSPDTLIPDPGNPLDYNRYAYTAYNPLKYTDPSGHSPCGDIYDPACVDWDDDWDPGYQNDWNLKDDNLNPENPDTSFTPPLCPAVYDEYVIGPDEMFLQFNAHFDMDVGPVWGVLQHQASYGTNYYEAGFTILTVEETYLLGEQIAHSPTAETFVHIGTESGETMYPISLGVIEAAYPGNKQNRSTRIAVPSKSPVSNVAIKVIIHVIGVRAPAEQWYRFPLK